MKFLSIFLLSFFIVFPVSAHPGEDFDENNCHVCIEDCVDWSLFDGENHCHDEFDGYTNSQGDIFDVFGIFLYNPDEVELEVNIPEIEDEVVRPEELIIEDEWLLTLEAENEILGTVLDPSFIKPEEIITTEETKGSELSDSELKDSIKNSEKVSVFNNVEVVAVGTFDGVAEQVKDKLIIKLGAILIAFVFLLLAIFLIIKYKKNKKHNEFE